MTKLTFERSNLIKYLRPKSQVENSRRICKENIKKLARQEINWKIYNKLNLSTYLSSYHLKF